MAIRQTRRAFGRMQGALALGAALAGEVSWNAHPAQAAAAGQAVGRAPLGTNLSRIDEWSGEYPFLNVFKQSRQWFSGTATTWQDTRTLDLDAHGWVRSLQSGQWAKTIMCWGPHVRYPSGRYKVTFDGEGTIQYTPNVTVVENAPGRQVVNVDSSQTGIGLFITNTDPNHTGNYLRNIYVAPPVATADGAIFEPTFLDRIKTYKTIRFKDWQATDGQWSVGNGSKQRVWSDRPTLDGAQWTQTHGVPLEVCCALANMLGANAWVNLPHLAEDDYAYQMAQFVLQRLNPGLKIYVEYSNECWNGNYEQAAYCQRQGVALNLSATGDPFQAQMRFYSKRAVELFKIWETVIPKDRLVRVMGSQMNPWVSEQVLGFGDSAAHVDALAVAPYFNFRPDEESTVPGMSLDQLFNTISNVLLPRVRTAENAQAATAAKYNVKLVSYEGGQHLVGLGPYANDATVNALFDAANRDPRMGQVYSRWLQDWNDAGGQLLMHFVNCGVYSTGAAGRFGSLEYIDEPRSQAPKYDALQRWIEGS